MSAFRRFVSPIWLSFLFSVSPAGAQDFNALSIEELRAVVSQSHPAGYYILASKLYEAGERDEAVFWFYAGQLRYRTHLACHPDLPPDGDAALFGALSDVIGAEINQYAFGDLDTLMSTIDSVIAWDSQTPPPPAVERDCTEAQHQIVSGLEDLQTYISENADEVRSQRAASGLPNR